MKRFTTLFAIALLAAGCASRSAMPATTASARLTEPARTTPPDSQVVELRHFYLLSPGPSARLVVTRSDVATGER